MLDFCKRFFNNPSRFVLAFFLMVLILVAILGPAIAPYDPLEIRLEVKLSPPDSSHWLGTDNLGRDILSRIIAATRISLGAGLLVLLVSATTGTILGLVSGYVGGLVDEFLMRVTDIFLAFPALVLALAIAAVLGPGLRNAMLAISVAWWPWYARMVRGMVLSLKENEYVTAAKCIGSSGWRIGSKHILPNLITPVIVQATMDMGAALVTASSLSFLGLGVQPPQPEWGAMINQGRGFVFAAWWMGAFPGLAIFCTVYLFNLLGEAVNATFSRSQLSS